MKRFGASSWEFRHLLDEIELSCSTEIHIISKPLRRGMLVGDEDSMPIRVLLERVSGIRLGLMLPALGEWDVHQLGTVPLARRGVIEMSFMELSYLCASYHLSVWVIRGSQGEALVVLRFGWYEDRKERLWSF
eukprot:CAMPEP_0114528868 /NCGR_PEP_ID=MMETSP0109-20121206/24486_1 /TAXON_ID=29199 /ORGANISM="Chlorarachnion reptans, Strain CCCM449" /LENGTH=132 /DNA_ID=CAMNT_0001711143 /DNA_START=762 /DNA_END=1160 /DNA_ORIENTATION=-